jgi:hypothetical protein
LWLGALEVVDTLNTSVSASQHCRPGQATWSWAFSIQTEILLSHFGRHWGLLTI